MKRENEIGRIKRRYRNIWETREVNTKEIDEFPDNTKCIRLSKLRALIVKRLLKNHKTDTINLYSSIWGSDFINLSLLHVHIYYLRKELHKIGADILMSKDSEMCGYYELIGIAELRGRIAYAESHDH